MNNQVVFSIILLVFLICYIYVFIDERKNRKSKIFTKTIIYYEYDYFKYG